MDELKDLLQKNLEVSEKTLKILKGMRRSAKLRTVLSALKWVVIIGLTAYSFFQLQPYLNILLQTYQGILNTAGQVNKILPILPK